MSGPFGTPEPLGIFIHYSDTKGGWVATAVVGESSIELDGPSSSFGPHPAGALQHLLEKSFCAFNSADFAATMIELEVLTPLDMLSRDLVAGEATRDRLSS